MWSLHVRHTVGTSLIPRFPFSVGNETSAYAALEMDQRQYVDGRDGETPKDNVGLTWTTRATRRLDKSDNCRFNVAVLHKKKKKWKELQNMSLKWVKLPTLSAP